MHFPPMPEKASLRPSYWEDVKATGRVNNNLLQIFFGEIVISIAQSAKFSFKQNFVMNRNNVNINLSHFRHLCGNARETQLSVLVRGLACSCCKEDLLLIRVITRTDTTVLVQCPFLKVLISSFILRADLHKRGSLEATRKELRTHFHQELILKKS